MKATQLCLLFTFICLSGPVQSTEVDRCKYGADKQENSCFDEGGSNNQCHDTWKYFYDACMKVVHYNECISYTNTTYGQQECTKRWLK
jgi:hypothetical protein